MFSAFDTVRRIINPNANFTLFTRKFYTAFAPAMDTASSFINSTEQLLLFVATLMERDLR